MYNGSNDLNLKDNIINKLSENETNIINTAIYNNSYYKVAFKNENDIVGINTICKEFAEATQICYKENASTLIKIKANPSEKYSSILRTMNENGEKEFGETNIYAFIVNDYNNYKNLTIELDRQ